MDSNHFSSMFIGKTLSTYLVLPLYIKADRPVASLTLVALSFLIHVHAVGKQTSLFFNFLLANRVFVCCSVIKHVPIFALDTGPGTVVYITVVNFLVVADFLTF